MSWSQESHSAERSYFASLNSCRFLGSAALHRHFAILVGSPDPSAQQRHRAAGPPDRFSQKIGPRPQRRRSRSNVFRLAVHPAALADPVMRRCSPAAALRLEAACFAVAGCRALQLPRRCRQPEISLPPILSLIAPAHFRCRSSAPNRPRPLPVRSSAHPRGSRFLVRPASAARQRPLPEEIPAASAAATAWRPAASVSPLAAAGSSTSRLARSGSSSRGDLSLRNPL